MEVRRDYRDQEEGSPNASEDMVVKKRYQAVRHDQKNVRIVLQE